MYFCSLNFLPDIPQRLDAQDAIVISAMTRQRISLSFMALDCLICYFQHLYGLIILCL